MDLLSKLGSFMNLPGFSLPLSLFLIHPNAMAFLMKLYVFVLRHCISEYKRIRSDLRAFSFQ